LLATLERPKATSLKFGWKQLRFLIFFGILEAISRRNPSEAESERTFLKIGILKANLIGFHEKVEANESRFCVGSNGAEAWCKPFLEKKSID